MNINVNMQQEHKEQKDNKYTKISKMNVFMDCDKIYYEEMTNLVIRISSFVKYSLLQSV